MELVVLAAGHGRRFGGLKQLAPVGPDGEALMDYTALDALEAGFDQAVLVVREEVREEILDHVSRRWPARLAVESVVQGPVAGTAQAVASAGSVLTGPFGVVNADDLYGEPAMALLAKEVGSLGEREHVLVGYRLADTILTEAPVTRGVCERGADGLLRRIAEQKVEKREGGYVGYPLGASPEQGSALSGGETVSMNLWGFSSSILDELDDAIAGFDPLSEPHDEGKPPELLLPSVVGDLVAGGRAQVRVVKAPGRCLGITHPDDLPLVREIVAGR